MKRPFAVFRRIAASTHELDANELQDDAAKMSCCPLSELRRGSQARVTGRLRSVTYTPRETVPTLAAELFDGSAAIELVWLGRRRIAGVEPGRRVLVEGRVGVHDGNLAIYNPRYTLRESG
jgi:RecJ-like exonuclease